VSQNTKADGSRTYTVPSPDGNGTVDYPSVTTVLKVVKNPNPLMWWAAGVVADYALDHLPELTGLLEKDDREDVWRMLRGQFRKKRDKAADLGTEVHNAIEGLILGQEVEVQPAARKYVDGFGQFVKDFGGEFEASEMTVFSHTHKYAGTLDALMRFDGRLGALDWKTRQGKSKAKMKAYESELLQLAAYARAEYVLLPNGDTTELPHIDGATVIMLCDDGYAMSKVPVDEAFPAFTACRTLFEFVEGLHE